VTEAHFKCIKEIPALNNMMPLSLVWMDHPVQQRRYFGLPKRLKPVKKVTASLFAQAKEFAMTFARFDGFVTEPGDRLCLLPDAFYLGGEKRVHPLYTKPFFKYQVKQDMQYMFGSQSTIPKHLQIMSRFGYADKHTGQVDFARLSKDINAYSQRVEEALQDCRNKLIELRGGFVQEPNTLTSFDRSQYSLEPSVILRELGDEDSSF
jgi:hypothetical protein